MALAFPSLDNLIATQEGFGKPGTIATNQHNPGNLIDNSWTASQPGYVGPGLQGIAVFSNDTSGFAAEDANVSGFAGRGATLSDLTAAWAPAGIPGNDPAAYASNLASGLGVSTDTPVSKLAGVTAPASGGSSLNPLSALDKAAMALDQYFGTGYPGEPQGADIAGAAGQAFSFGRIAAFVLGLICIAGAIFLFKPEASISVAKGAAGAAVLA